MKRLVIFVGVILALGAASAWAQAVTDAQIASIVVTANQVDIDAGKLAEANATNPDVKKFGAQMVTDHTGVNKSATELVKKLNVTPQDNPTSQSLKSGGEKNLANLKSLKGAAFDKAYIDHEVVYHQQVLDALDKTLIPNAKNEEPAAPQGEPRSSGFRPSSSRASTSSACSGLDSSTALIRRASSMSMPRAW